MVIDQQTEDNRKKREANEAEEAKRNLITLFHFKVSMKKILESSDAPERFSKFREIIETRYRLVSRS